jgi:hypothetical protein
VEAKPERLAAKADVMMAMEPVETIQIGGMKPAYAKLLAGHAFWERIRALDLSSQRLDAKALAAIFARPRFGRLRRLELDGNPLGDAGMATIATTPLPSLRELTLRRSGATAAGIAAIARIAGLEHIELDSDPVGDAAARALPQTLRVVHAFHCGIGDAGAAAIAAMPSLVVAYLRGNEIGDDGARALSRSKTIRKLWLADNRGIGDAGARAVLDMPALEELRIWDTQMSDKMADAIRARFGENAC